MYHTWHFCWASNVTQDKSQCFMIKYRKLLIRDTANMPRNNVRVDSCYQKAVEYLVKNPNLTVQEGMTLAGRRLASQHQRESNVPASTTHKFWDQVTIATRFKSYIGQFRMQMILLSMLSRKLDTMHNGSRPHWPAYERWTDEDKERLGALATTEDIDMSDTQYGH